MKKFVCFVKTLVGTPADECGSADDTDEASQAPEAIAIVTKAGEACAELSDDQDSRGSSMIIKMVTDDDFTESAEIGSRGDTCDPPASPASPANKPEAATAASSGGEEQQSSEADTCSWEPKKKDVRVASRADDGDGEADGEADRFEKLDSAKQADVIHPLQNSWGIWCFMQNRSQNWHENMRHISNFSSVEDFWSLYNHIQTVDKLQTGCDYFVFKANIQPMWEDKANVRGGRWLLKLPSSQQNFMQLWMETLLLLVGEAFEYDSDSVCGGVAQVRRGLNKISIWTRDANDRDTCVRIGNRWKKCLKTRVPINYEAHMEANKKGNRRSKSVYMYSIN